MFLVEDKPVGLGYGAVLSRFWDALCLSAEWLIASWGVWLSGSIGSQESRLMADEGKA